MTLLFSCKKLPAEKKSFLDVFFFSFFRDRVLPKPHLTGRHNETTLAVFLDRLANLAERALRSTFLCLAAPYHSRANPAMEMLKRAALERKITYVDFFHPGTETFLHAVSSARNVTNPPLFKKPARGAPPPPPTPSACKRYLFSERFTYTRHQPPTISFLFLQSVRAK